MGDEVATCDRETISVLIERDYIISIRSFRGLELRGMIFLDVCKSGLFQYITCCHACEVNAS